MTGRAKRLPLIGLEREQRTLHNAVLKRESLLLLGPAGSGKSALLESAWQAEGHSERLIYIPRFKTPHNLFVSLARELILGGHKTFQRLISGATQSESRIEEQTSTRLKGLLWQALEEEPRTILLDHLNGPSRSVYRFLQRLSYAPGMAIVGAARDSLCLGELRRLFWDPRQTLHLQPLSKEEAIELFEAAADYFDLAGLDLDEFREKVLDGAAGIPGQIVEMCRLASDPRYHNGKYIKFSLIRIEAKMAQLG